MTDTERLDRLERTMMSDPIRCRYDKDEDCFWVEINGKDVQVESLRSAIDYAAKRINL